MDGEAVRGSGVATDSAAMKQNSVLHDSQPKTGTSLIAAAALIHAVKPLAKIGQMFFSYTYTIIGYRKSKHAGLS